MATALLVTFTANARNEHGYMRVVGITSQCLTFVDVPQAQKALALMRETYHGDYPRGQWPDSYVVAQGHILKDVVI